MSEFKIDSEKVKESIDTLKKLLDKCEEAYDKEIPKSDVDKGSSHKELDELCENMKTTCQYLGELINNTIRFLNGSSEMFDTSDRESADVIRETVDDVSSVGIVYKEKASGGGIINGPTPERENKSAIERSLELYAEGGKVYTGNYARSSNYFNCSGTACGFYTYENGCTWYALNRYNEMNPEAGLVFSGRGGHAKNWGNSIDKNLFNVISTSDASNISRNSIALKTNGTYGHVAYIEAVHEGYVYYTESAYSNPSIAGQITRKTIAQFQSEFSYTISAKS